MNNRIVRGFTSILVMLALCTPVFLFSVPVSASTSINTASGLASMVAGDYSLSADIDIVSPGTFLGAGYATVLDLNGHNIMIESSNVEIGQFKIVGAMGSGDWASVYVHAVHSMSNINIHDIWSTATGGNAFATVSDGTINLSNVSYSRCFADSPDGFGFINDGITGSPVLNNFTYDDCRVRNAGTAATRAVSPDGHCWVTGYDFVEYPGLTIQHLRVNNCLSCGSWEAGFHFEYAPTKIDCILTNCKSYNYGEKHDDPAGPVYDAGYLTSGDVTLTNCVSDKYYTDPAPSISTYAADGVSPTHAHLHGHVNTMETETSLVVGFEVGRTTSYELGDIIAINSPMVTTGDFDRWWEGLTPNTTYHIKAFAQGSTYFAEGSDVSFTTSVSGGEPTPTPGGASESLYASNPVDELYDAGQLDGAANYWRAQTITPSVSHTITRIGLYGRYYTNPASVTVSIRNVTDGNITGSDINNSTGTITLTGPHTENYTWVYGTLSSGVPVVANSTYAIVFRDSGEMTTRVTPPENFAGGNCYTSSDSGGTWANANNDMVFEEYGINAVAPSITTNSAANLSNNGANFWSTLTSLGTSSAVNVHYEYGTSTGYGSTTSNITVTNVGYISDAITGLSMNTTYHYRAVAIGDGTTNGNDVTFTTMNTAANPPIVVTGAPLSVTATTATLIGQLASMGSSTSIPVCFEYGTSTAYSNRVVSGPEGFSGINMTMTGQFSIGINGLTPGTIYHVRAVANYGLINQANGYDQTFTTSSASTLNDPLVTTNWALNIQNTSADLYGSLIQVGSHTPVTVWFQIRPAGTTQWHTVTPSIDLTERGNYNLTANSTTCGLGITPNTNYEFQAVAVNGYMNAQGQLGNYGEIDTFSTNLNATPGTWTFALNPASNVTKYTATLSGQLSGASNTANVTVYFDYGVGGTLINSYPATRTGNGAVLYNASGLAPNTTYWYRARVYVDDNYQVSPSLAFTTIADSGTTPGITPTTTSIPAPTGTGIPVPSIPLPSDFGPSVASYEWLIGLTLGCPFLLMFIFSEKEKKLIGIVFSLLTVFGVWALWYYMAWLDGWFIGLLIALVAGLVAPKIAKMVQGN